RPVTVRVGMEHGFQARLQIPTDNLLRDAIGYRRDAQRTRAAAGFGDVHPPHRWREVAPRGQPVPEPVEVARKSRLELRNRLSIHSSRSPVGLHLLEGLPDFPLRDVERLCLGHAAPPVTGWPPTSAGHRSPFGPVPLQNLHPYYGLLRPCAPHRYSGSCGGLPLELLPWHRGDRFPRSTKEPDPGSRRLQAGRRSGRASGLRPNSSQGPLPSPWFRHRPVNFGTSSAVRLRSSLRISPDGIKSRLFLRRSPPPLLTAAARSGLKPAPDRRLRGACPHLFCSSTPPLQSVCSRRTRCIRSRTSATCLTEIAAVGSSISTMRACERRVRAMATACRCPPDICRTRSRGL